MQYLIIAIYLAAIFAIFIIPLYLNISRARVVLLSWIPSFLLASIFTAASYISILLDDKITFTDLTLIPLILFFDFLIFSYFLMFPIVITVSFVIEYLRNYYHLTTWHLSIIAALLGALMVAVTFQSWKFIAIALVSGFLAVWIQYYFTEYRKREA